METYPNPDDIRENTADILKALPWTIFLSVMALRRSWHHWKTA